MYISYVKYVHDQVEVSAELTEAKSEFKKNIRVALQVYINIRLPVPFLI